MCALVLIYTTELVQGAELISYSFYGRKYGEKLACSPGTLGQLVCICSSATGWLWPSIIIFVPLVRHFEI